MPKSVVEQVYEQLTRSRAELTRSGTPLPKWQRWAMNGAIVIAGAAVLAPAVIQLGSSLRAAGGSSNDRSDSETDGFQLRCRACGDLVDEDDAQDGLCEECADSDSDAYCCGIMYSGGESRCRSCGEPL